MSKVIVVGGGAAGMMAAAFCAQNGHSVTLYEQNEKLGKKLYITGKGRCNLTNACETEELFRNVVSNPRFLYSAFHGFTNQDTISYFESIGLKLKIERGQRVFPVSDHSSDVIRSLERELKRLGVRIQLNTKVAELLTQDGRFAGVRLAGGAQTTAEAGILATGGLSYPTTGATGDGYRMAKRLGHSVTRLYPSLVGIRLNSRLCGELEGLSLRNVRVSVKVDAEKQRGAEEIPGGKESGSAAEALQERGPEAETEGAGGHGRTEGISGESGSGHPAGTGRSAGDGRAAKASQEPERTPMKGKKRLSVGSVLWEEFGELVFTAHGVSGPVILSASSYIAERLADYELSLHIDLKPALSEEQLDARILRDFDEAKNKRYKNALEHLLPQKLIPVIMKLSGILPDRQVNAISREERRGLAALLKDLALPVAALGDYSEAVITKGGISVKEVNPSTMESKLVPGLYFAGEVLDVDALTGGFNLQIAWSSAHLAASSIP
ncbi:MAG: NAD(P)/FAD-dependent oxidoreductase [Lachnospiraceae bacterium]|nr:NAD(P)/FAD-dependent oxidoreductase [Lachnospiraceae bacterium]